MNHRYEYHKLIMRINLYKQLGDILYKWALWSSKPQHGTAHRFSTSYCESVIKVWAIKSTKAQSNFYRLLHK